MVALGAPISAVCISNRWSSQRQAWEYAVPGLDWEFELPDQAPWPHPVAGFTTQPLSSVHLWLASAPGRRTPPDASSSPIIIMGVSDDEGDNSDDRVLGILGANRGVAPGGLERRARTPGRRQDAAHALRARSRPSSQTRSPPVPQPCSICSSLSARDSAPRKRKPSAECATIAAPEAGVGPGQVPGANQTAHEQGRRWCPPRLHVQPKPSQTGGARSSNSS